ncbi:unnamed protein product [Symbiodinium natans]|uniref:Uncharacterized protein n=1 Tax=Symbiodinium natans TaxID=878477 RepID=A0A812QIF5_9DINO|nr:unnamed protein product [Symbiodinium natans]
MFLEPAPQAPTEDLPLPEGFKPLVGFKLCPPGGVYLQLFFWLLDNVTDVIQIVTFVLHKDFGFAFFVGFFVAMGLVYALFVMVQLESDSIANRGGPIAGSVLLAPFRAAVESAEAGVATMTWGWILRAEQQIEAFLVRAKGAQMRRRSLMMIVSFDSEYNLNKPVTTIRSPRFLLLRMRKGQDKQGAVDQVQPVRSPLTTVFPNMCSLPSQGYIKISDILLYMIWQGISDLPELMPGREGLQKSPL